MTAWVLAEGGAVDEAKAIVERLLAGAEARRFTAGFALLALGRQDEGFAALAGLPQQLVSYLWLLPQKHEALASDPRFRKLLEQLNATDDFKVAQQALNTSG